MLIKLLLSVSLLCLLVPQTSMAVYVHEGRYYYPHGYKICNSSGYRCKHIKRGDTWAKLWPNRHERNIVRRVNRMNTRLYPGFRIAVPRKLRSSHVMDYSPFARRIRPPGKNLIIVDHQKFAFGAYSPSGKLLKWGPAVGGMDWCSDMKGPCRTVRGDFHIYHKRGANCKSRQFPVGKGGSKMPYCSFFHRGYALHGSSFVAGFHSSHGCIRLFTEDARWIQQVFMASSPGKTRVIVR